MPPLLAAPLRDAKTALANALLLREVSPAAIEEVARVAEWVFLAGGHLLFRTGSLVESVFIVLSGRLQVLKTIEGREYLVSEVLAGGSVGELALLTNEPSAHTVRAARDTQLVRMSRPQFDGLAMRYPELALALARQVARSHQIDPRPRAPVDTAQTIAVLPLSRDAPLHEFVRQLEDALSARKRVRSVDEECVVARQGAQPSTNAVSEDISAEASDWLNALEREYDVVIYEATPEASPWSRRCVRQADRVLGVALADAGPRDGQLATAFFDAVAGCDSVVAELVLLHTDGSLRPRLTHVWRGVYPFALHHHVRMTARSDFERLTRRLTGEAVGLVLSGGGARAFAFGGVIRAIEEAGVPIDLVGGTSAGALVAAHYAYGYDLDTMIELNRAWSRRQILDYTIPFVALLSSRRPKRILAHSFGDARIEDLWLPFFCVSTDLTQAELVVHSAGPIAKWVRASLSVPGVMPPTMSDNGDMLVDGAVLNNVPVDVMRRFTPGPIIAVDVCPSVDLSFGPGNRVTPPPWQLMSSTVERSERRRFVPPIFRILHRAALLHSERQRREAQSEADLYLTPPVSAFDMFDWDAIPELVRIGYRYAVPMIAEWKRNWLSPSLTR